MAANDGGAAALKRKQDVEVAKKVEPSPSKPEPKAVELVPKATESAAAKVVVEPSTIVTGVEVTEKSGCCVIY